MSAKLIIAIPAKGRLMDNSLEFMTRCGFKVERESGARGYNGRIKGINDIKILFLSAKEIASALYSGQVHLGITGADTVMEAKTSYHKQLPDLLDLGFGFADLVVAVPEGWIDVQTMADLCDVSHNFYHNHHRNIKISTKYVGLTRDFLNEHGITAYQIVESFGATEAATASGVADLIADITTSGATLAANGLRPVSDGVIMRSQAKLFISPFAPWSHAPQTKAIDVMRQLLDQIEASLNADKYLQIRTTIDKDVNIATTIKQLPGLAQTFYHQDNKFLLCYIEACKMSQAIAFLKSHAITNIAVSRCEYMYSDKASLFTTAKNSITAQSSIR